MAALFGHARASVQDQLIIFSLPTAASFREELRWHGLLIES